VNELLEKYYAWQKQIAEVREFEELLDVENSQVEAAIYELMVKRRLELYNAFMLAYRASDKEVQEALREQVLARRKEKEHGAAQGQ
jgi:hypothetical protein